MNETQSLGPGFQSVMFRHLSTVVTMFCGHCGDVFVVFRAARAPRLIHVSAWGISNKTKKNYHNLRWKLSHSAAEKHSGNIGAIYSTRVLSKRLEEKKKQREWFNAEIEWWIERMSFPQLLKERHGVFHHDTDTRMSQTICGASEILHCIGEIWEPICMQQMSSHIREIDR